MKVEVIGYVVLAMYHCVYLWEAIFINTTNKKMLIRIKNILKRKKNK